MENYQEWTVKIKVSNTWVEDGFYLDEERLIDMLQNELRFATSCEVDAEILEMPDPEIIAKLQGD